MINPQPSLVDTNRGNSESQFCVVAISERHSLCNGTNFVVALTGEMRIAGLAHLPDAQELA